MGSSPRVRGEACYCAAVARGGGIIPAGAGRSERGLCGAEHDGIIPAGAGRSRRKARMRACWRDHPRGCGEKYKTPHPRRAREGSSPRVRGEVARGVRALLERGIIPAGAGRRGHVEPHQSTNRDHPRGCGEKSCCRKTSTSARGSSPRVRGEVRILSTTAVSIGIIPAGAGRRASSIQATAFPRDHPRGCGEKGRAAWMSAQKRGSSPRVRGEGVETPAWMACMGIIPAGAGRRPDSRLRSG